LRCQISVETSIAPDATAPSMPSEAISVPFDVKLIEPRPSDSVLTVGSASVVSGRTVPHPATPTDPAIPMGPRNARRCMGTVTGRPWHMSCVSGGHASGERGVRVVEGVE
jgi:hypothetical protein